MRGNDTPYPWQPIIDGKRKERRIVHEAALLTIWFSSTIAGMLITILMPHIITEVTGNGRSQNQPVPISSDESLQRQRTEETWIERAA
jgi:hypothetical protein